MRRGPPAKKNEIEGLKRSAVGCILSRNRQCSYQTGMQSLVKKVVGVQISSARHAARSQKGDLGPFYHPVLVILPVPLPGSATARDINLERGVAINLYRE